MAVKQRAYLKDYLLVYAQNQLAPLPFYVAVVMGFLIGKLYMTGASASPMQVLMYEALLLLPLVSLVLLRRYYRQILSWKDYPMPDREAQNIMVRIAVHKLFYMVPWLVLLFFPLQIRFLYDHLLGFAFVFAAMSVYASASAVLLPMLIFDIGLQMGFAGFVTWLNRDIQETPYVGGVLAIFAVFTLYLGIKFHQSQVDLIRSRQQSDQNAKNAQHANEAKTRFLALMSHEIRTPMTGIVGMVEFMKETSLSNEQSTFLNTISECSKTLLNTLNDILDISKLEAGKLDISNINCDFHNVLANCVRLLTRIAEDKRIYVKLDIAPDVPKLIYGDPHRIQQVVTNLLNNAVKFTQEGGVTVAATFVPGAIPMLHVEVTDTGIGISKENMKKLFKSFSQADSSIARKYGGTGLGLSIIKNLMGLMGGKIGVRSEEGQGSTFWFDLPYHEPHADEAAAENEGVPALQPLGVLLAEDNRVNQQIAQRLLGNKGHSVTIADDGVAAVRLANENRYDVILMDVNMPLKSGLAATEEIRAGDGPNALTPIIALTASIIDEQVKNCLAAGMTGYVAKPFSPVQLYREMAKQLPQKVLTIDQQRALEEEQKKAKKAQNVIPPPPIVAQVAEMQAQAQVRKPGLTDNLREIRQELGAAYMTQLIDNSIREVRSLMTQIQDENTRHDYELLHRHAHDLKGVSGLIGMSETCRHAEAVEKACTRKEYDSIAALLEKLVAESARECGEMEAVRGEAAA